MGWWSCKGGRVKGLVRMILSHHQRSTIASPCRPQPQSSYTPRFTPSATMTTINNLEDIFTQKKMLRSKVKKDLRLMDPTLRSHQDDAIQNLILEAPWFNSCKGLCAYISCSALREVDTSKVLRHILNNPTKDGETETTKRLYVPRVEDKNCHMRMLNISGMDDLIANSMNILEPAPVDANGNDREDVMLANEPGWQFMSSSVGGFGLEINSYYDTFLSKYQELAKLRNWKQPLLIALSYSVQILEDDVIPVTESDVFIDALVSPSGFIPISPVAKRLDV
nr:5-formyltetrahydrofolate cyclo-ligase, mitochondrial [Tanacetum cinerariifolium]